MRWVGRAPTDILKEIWGYNGFRLLQAEVIQHAINGGSCTVLAPTGGGKSLCYQIPAMARSGTGIVISPLVSLMQDQVAALKRRGVAAAMLGGGQSREEQEAVMAAAWSSNLDLLYLSPERLESSDIRRFATHHEISIVAVDECHVVSSWGNEFRPSYREIPSFLRLIPENVSRIALTATADGLTLADVRSLLGLSAHPLFTSSFERDNIVISMHCMKNKKELEKAAFKALDDLRGLSGILYCRTRRDAESWAKKLVEKGIPARPYHAGMDLDARRAAYEFFMENPSAVITATVAFGMGIDKADTRWVMHVGLPSSPEAYAQEIGRAGRDGYEANAILFWCESDIPRTRALMEAARQERQGKAAVVKDPGEEASWSAGVDEAHERAVRQRFEIMAALARSGHCRPRALAAWMGEDLGKNCGRCDACTNPPETVDSSSEVYAILSLLEQAGHSVGAFRICETLLGSGSYHDLRLPVSGKLSGKSRREILHIIGQLLSGGWIHVPPSGKGGLSLSESGTSLLSALRDEEFVFRLVPVSPLPTDVVPAQKGNRAEPLDWTPLYERIEWVTGVPMEEMVPERVLRDLPFLKNTDKENLLKAGIPQGIIMLCEKEWARFLGWNEITPVSETVKPKFGKRG